MASIHLYNTYPPDRRHPGALQLTTPERGQKSFAIPLYSVCFRVDIRSPRGASRRFRPLRRRNLLRRICLTSGNMQVSRLHPDSWDQSRFHSIEACQLIPVVNRDSTSTGENRFTMRAMKISSTQSQGKVTVLS